MWQIPKLTLKGCIISFNNVLIYTSIFLMFLMSLKVTWSIEIIRHKTLIALLMN